MNNPELQNARLDRLFEERYSGASNIKGIRFQILYTVLKAFELYDASSDAYLQLEGIEDVDLKGCSLGSQYIQAKSSGKRWGWAEFTRKNKAGQPVMIKNFLEALQADQTAMFHIVYDFELRSGLLSHVVEFCSGEVSHMSEDLVPPLRKAFREAGFPDMDVGDFLSRLSFEKLTADGILKKQVGL